MSDTSPPSAPSPSGRSASTLPRESWTGQVGFILAAIGSAVGLGNIWRFPGVAYENGGGAFLIPYLVALLTAGIPILFLDYAIGHRFRGSAPAAFRRLGGRFGRWAESIGWFQVAICFVIATYYTAIIAWALSYFVFSIDLRWGDDPVGFLTGEYLQVGEPGLSFEFVPGVLIPLVIVWLVAIAVLAGGVAKGIERVNVIAIPLLVVGFLALVIRALFLDGASTGLDALFTPHWEALADPGVWVAAYSQIFFSLSIAFGIMLTYSSYRRRRSNLTGPGLVIAFANSSFEVLAGIGVFATLGFFAFQQGIGFDQLENLTGVGLSFMTFPAIVSQMPGGPVFGMLFFGALAIAGFTSLISILQVVSAAVQEKASISPRAAALWVGGVCAVISVLLFSTATGLLALDVIDSWTNNVGVVLSAIVVSIVVLWVYRRGRELTYHLNALSTFKVGRTWFVFVAVVAPVVLSYMLVARVIELIVEGYADMPGWYLGVFGWGTFLFLVVAALIGTLIKWRRSPDDFTPWPPLTAELAGRTETRS
ncbi:sodium-dependent transporter [Pseudoclavibacter endophyticus]|uniref:Sodium-dependent transporter n=1 Tax=Pseudoclavibacter endophyticus TaxID=1778590 RepID=A0A6H9WDA3_9MICO|nr:sodium-dependent transporter [Pseudoclavibacter endophyticus]KAB1648879.1 sodium-dependent transporter [Pseudoclavibacter endophyticus]GGA67564.1 sodium-dependent transporter [Pseudoclavibacter endophyticus]